MRASILDLRRRMSEVLKALDRNESVTILYRGKEKGILHPINRGKSKYKSIADHPAFGMWKDRDDMKDVAKYIRDMRRGRFDAVRQ